MAAERTVDAYVAALHPSRYIDSVIMLWRKVVGCGAQRTPWTLLEAPSKPLVGIRGDVDERIVPVASPPAS